MAEMKHMILFVDKISFLSLLRILGCGRSFQSIIHFEPTTTPSRWGLSILYKLRLIRTEIQQIQNNISELRNNEGESYIEIFNEIKAICTKIREEHIINNSLINIMASEWDKKKIILHFEQVIEKEIKLECLRIGLIEWILRSYFNLTNNNAVLMVERKQWFPYLKTYAETQGIRMVQYGSTFSQMIGKSITRSYDLFKRSIPILKQLGQKVLRFDGKYYQYDLCQNKSVSEHKNKSSRIAIQCQSHSLSFDPYVRSPIFWINRSRIPYSEILLYGYDGNKPLDVETLHAINSSGIKILGHGPAVPEWTPRLSILTTLLRVYTTIVWNTFTLLLIKRWISIYYVAGLLYLATHYSYWFHFFKSNRVLIRVSTIWSTSVGEVLALDALNGVTAAYQYSIADVGEPIPTTLDTGGDNVQFIFSRAIEKGIWRNMERPVDKIVYTGYIYDNVLKNMNNSKYVAKIRKQLHDNGAQFILCYFDENSVDKWDIPAQHNEAAADYEYLLKWLLSDPTIGMIFKPKKPGTLFKRIACVSTSILDQAEKTGRCKFLVGDSNFIVSNIFPAQAALMSDLCIGKLGGCTAALEARLAGVPTIIIDREGMYTHPICKWGQGSVVFDDWETLRSAVKQYRSAPKSQPRFGDWSPGLNDFDQFQDGQASVRMTSYVHWVYEALKQGESKKTALKIAAEKHEQRWGNEHIAL